MKAESKAASAPPSADEPTLLHAAPKAPNRPKVFGVIAAATVVIVLLNAATLQLLVKPKTSPDAPANLRTSLAWPNPLVPLPNAQATPRSTAVPAQPAATPSGGAAAVTSTPHQTAPTPTTATVAPPTSAAIAPVLRPKLESDSAPASTRKAAPMRPALDLSTLAASKAGNGAAPSSSALTQKSVSQPASVANVEATAVQIGAFASPEIAEDTWRKAQVLLASEAVGRHLSVEPVSVNGSTLYRALILGFRDRPEAAGYCRSLQTKGFSCFVRK